MSVLQTDQQAIDGYWASAERHALEAPYCADCAKFFFYPRPFCPHCWSDKVELRPVSGQGTVWSYTVVRFAHGKAAHGFEAPYVVALIDLDESIRVMSNVVGCPPEEVQSGMRVRVDYRKVGERTLPMYVRA